MIKNLLHCDSATAAVEAAIFTPIFLLFTFGITDLGAAMFARTQINAATQAGAIYAVVNSASTCKTPFGPACLTAINAAMNDATGDASFCTGTVCTATTGACDDDPAGTCIIVTATFPYSPILLDTAYVWARSVTITATTKVRIS